MNGLRYVRNAHEHDFIVIADTPALAGLGWVNGQPATLIVCHWRPLTDDDKNENLDPRRTVQRNVYEAELAGHSVRYSLLKAMKFLRDEGSVEVEFGKHLDSYPPPMVR